MSKWKPSPVRLEQGGILVRLAESQAEVLASQELRQNVFFPTSGSQKAAMGETKARRDNDQFDDYCDHLLAVDVANDHRLVGSYRLLREKNAKAVGQYIADDEFDLSALDHLKGNKLELGRAVVDPDYRNKPVATTMWLGIGAYVFAYDIDVLFGCGSYPGLDKSAHAMAMSFMAQTMAAPKPIQFPVKQGNGVVINQLTPDEVNPRQAMREMPPLLRGYAYMGAWFSTEAFVDTVFETIDVLVCVSAHAAPEKYHRRFKRSDYMVYRPDL